MIIDCPEIQWLDIHPLLASGPQLTLLDATVALAPFDGESESRLAIRPYPQRLEEWVTLKDGKQVLFRLSFRKMSLDYVLLFLRSQKKISTIVTSVKSMSLPTMIWPI